MNPEEKTRTDYSDTMEALRQAESALPDFSTSYDGEIRRLYEKIVNRPAFQYDPVSDPMYQSYRDRMVSEGGRAMRDTVGQASALTGGYGSSYAERVGQQQYGLYLQKLGQMMPELYEAAYARYRDEGADLQGQLTMARGLADSEYGRRRDRFSLAASMEQQRYDREQDAWARGEKSYQKLVSLISQSGYMPNDQELQAAGMSRAQAEALRNDYLMKNPMAMMLSGEWPLAGIGGDGGGYAYTGGSGGSKSSATKSGSTKKTGTKSSSPGPKDQAKLGGGQSAKSR